MSEDWRALGAEGGRLMREGSPADQFWLLFSGVVELDFHVPGNGSVPI